MKETKQEPRYWWINPSCYNTIGAELPKGFPRYLKKQYASRLGRPGRCRLWVDEKVVGKDVGIHEWPETPFSRWLEKEDFAAIVIRDEDVKLLSDLPGIVTNRTLKVVGVV